MNVKLVSSSSSQSQISCLLAVTAHKIYSAVLLKALTLLKYYTQLYAHMCRFPNNTLN